MSSMGTCGGRIAGYFSHTTDVSKSLFTRPSTYRAAIIRKVSHHLSWEAAAVYEEYIDLGHEKLEWTEGEVLVFASDGELSLAPLFQERVEGLVSSLSMKALMSEKTFELWLPKLR
jgi:hypothetical protein